MEKGQYEFSDIYITFSHMGKLRVWWDYKNAMRCFPSSTLCTENWYLRGCWNTYMRLPISGVHDEACVWDHWGPELLLCAASLFICGWVPFPLPLPQELRLNIGWEGIPGPSCVFSILPTHSELFYCRHQQAILNLGVIFQIMAGNELEIMKMN